MLEMAILGLLKQQPMHGYDLRKRLRSDFGLLSSLSFGSLYPALARLERDGAVREVTDIPPAPSAEVVAFTGSLAGERAAFRARLAARSAPASTRSSRGATSSRTRKVYELTSHGEQLFDQLLTDDRADGTDGVDGKVFALRWAFARHMSADARMRLLERRKRQLEDRLSIACKAADSPLRPLDRYERSLVDHSSAATRFELEWIDQIITSERALRPESGSESRSEPAAEVS